MTGRPAFSRLALLAVALVAVSSCTRSNAPAPVSVYNEQPAPSAPGMITVGRGDTVYELAQRYNVPMREVIELNRLTPPYALAVGQHLKLPTARFYMVQRGDTMYSISRMHQVGMSELARANGLQEPYAIRVGQQLQLPGGGPPAVQVAESSRAALPQQPASIPIAPPAASRPIVVAEPLPEAPQPQPQASAPQSVAPAMPQQDPSLPPYQPRRGFGMAQSWTAPAPATISQPAPAPVLTPAPVEATRAPSAQPVPSIQPQPSIQPTVQPPVRNQVAALPPRPVPTPAPAPSPAPSPVAHPIPKVPPRPAQPAQAPQAASIPTPAATPVPVPAPPPPRTCGSRSSQATGDRISGAPWRKPVPMAGTRLDPVRLRPQARRSA